MEFSPEYLGHTNFTWFFGIVEDRGDPLKMGRVRVRAYGWHTSSRQTLPTNKLPWSQCVQSITSAAMDDMGETPLGPVEGTLVIGFFMDGKQAQRPMIIGTVSGINMAIGEDIKANGFADPSGNYPSRKLEPDVNRLARVDDEFPPLLPGIKNAARKLTVAKANSEETWNEPAAAWANSSVTYPTVYPKNHVRQSEAGHVFEVDTSPNRNRTHEYHPSGTFYEIDHAGNKVTRIVADDYEIVAGNKFVNVTGNTTLTVDGNVSTYIKGNWEVQVDGNKNEVIAGTLTQTVTGDVTETYSSDQSTQVTGEIDIDGENIYLN